MRWPALLAWWVMACQPSETDGTTVESDPGLDPEPPPLPDQDPDPMTFEADLVAAPASLFAPAMVARVLWQSWRLPVAAPQAPAPASAAGEGPAAWQRSG